MKCVDFLCSSYFYSLFADLTLDFTLRKSLGAPAYDMIIQLNIVYTWLSYQR